MFVFGYCANRVLGQELIGLAFLNGETTLTIVSIDPATGTQTPLMATPAGGVAAGPLAVDPRSRRLFFVSFDAGATWLYTADLIHRTISAAAETASTGAAGQLFWDPVGNQLIGLAYLPGEYTTTVSVVDPATAGLTPLVPTGAVAGVSAFDPVGRRIFFESGSQNGPPYAINVVDIANRTVSQPVPFPCCPNLIWDPEARRLLGLSFFNGQFPLTVVSIDPSTGSQTPLLPTPAGGVAEGWITIDTATGRVFFSDPFAQTLVTVNLQSGHVSQSPLAPCCPALGWLGLAATVPVPALDASGLAVLGLALAILGWRLAIRTPTH
jgi:hypothetical protein